MHISCAFMIPGQGINIAVDLLISINLTVNMIYFHSCPLFSIVFHAMEIMESNNTDMSAK